MLLQNPVSKQLPSSELSRSCTCFCLLLLRSGMCSWRSWKQLMDLFQSGWAKLVGGPVLMHSTVWTRTIACTQEFCNWLLKTRCRRKLLNRKLIFSSKLWRSWKRVFRRHFGAVFCREQTRLVSFSNLRQLVWDLQWVFFSHWVSLSRCYERETSSKSLLRWGRNVLDLYSFLRNEQFKRTSDDRSAQDVTLSCSEEFRISTFLVIIDSFPLTCVRESKPTPRLMSCSRSCGTLMSKQTFLWMDFYSEDLEDLNAVENEWFQWRSLLKNLDVTFCSPSEMLKLMVQNDFSTSFPNTYILLRQYLTLPVTNCTSERSSVTSNASNLL